MLSSSPVQVFVPKHLGDVVLALPALRRLASAMHRPVHVVSREWLHPVLAGQGAWSVGAHPLRGGDAVLLAPSLRVALAAWRAGCRLRIGAPTDRRGLLLTHRVLDLGSLSPDRVPRLLPREHQADAYLRVVDLALYVWRTAPSGARTVGIRLRPEDVACAARRWDQHGRPTVILHPCAAGPLPKAGGLPGWVGRGAALLADGHRLLVTGGFDADDDRRARRLGDLLGVPVASGENALPLMLWAALARRVGRVVAPDTGIAHLAAAAGAEVTVFFGPTDPRRHRPVGPGRVVVVDGGAGRACAPCYARSCAHAPDAACLDDLGARHSLGEFESPQGPPRDMS